MALRASRPLMKAFGPWDTRMFGDMMRPYNWYEMRDGYMAHSIVGFAEDHQGNNMLPAKSNWVRFKRGYGMFLFFWLLGWSEYICHMGHKTPGCPWSTHYDPSRERAF
eukprot:TRINITY_DN9240_c0_g2_i1.p1 TRINITY_DN9240_c0_g2~~TRINITY_DN9240_c0_g2_i1.p1  ORF type:complete len:108 (+),score=5.88 TRINITY_DN9240_c0_g2_i1:48-371(+)